MAERQAQWVSVYEAELSGPWQAQGCQSSLQAFSEIQIGVSLSGKICKNRFDKFFRNFHSYFQSYSMTLTINY